ncbi:MAG: hypothetical protein BWX84_02381 [Verrucomicrobia bacterium ADurb.Bin118]|nr:MAG: hypothetical protein BWX84_02381 [Verrucomicrobia bacterium ADurb.Bin118]
MIQGLTANRIGPVPVTKENTSTSVFRSSTPLLTRLVLAGSFSGVVETMLVRSVMANGVAVYAVLPWSSGRYEILLASVVRSFWVLLAR